MLEAIKHGLRNLINFNGRDARQAFWFFVLFLYLVTIGLNMAVTMTMMMGGMMNAVNEGIAHAQSGVVDDAAAEAAIQGKVFEGIADYMPVLIAVGLVSALILLFGLAAAIVRRLHDADLSGAWALLPLGLQAVSAALIPSQMGKMQEAMLQTQLGDPLVGMQMFEGSVGLEALTGWGAILAVVILCTRPSTPGPNRFGDAPFVA